LNSRTILQVVLLLAVVAVLTYVVVQVSTGWADWVVLGAIVLTVLGGARAVFYRRYPTKKRTFVRHAGPGER
jgi:uncharacterized membrane protein